MYFPKLLTLTLLPAALSLPTAPVLIARDANAVNASITQVAANLVALNNSVTSIRGGLFNIGKALDVQKKTSALSDSLQATTDAATASAPFNDLESLTVGLSLLNLQPQIYSTLDNLASKKPAFDSIAGIFSLRKTVLSNLETQKALSAELGDAITEKLTEAFKALAPGINQGIQDRFTQTIAVFQQKGAGIPLPPLPSFGR